MRFDRVSSVDAWNDVWLTPKVAARRSDCFETQPGAASAWIRLGELQAQDIECAPFDKKKFAKAIKSIRKLTVDSQEDFTDKMRRLYSDAGD